MDEQSAKRSSSVTPNVVFACSSASTCGCVRRVGRSNACSARVSRRSRMAVQSVLIPGPLVAQLNRLSQREGVTLFMTLLAAFEALLARYSQHEEITVGLRNENFRQNILVVVRQIRATGTRFEAADFREGFLRVVHTDADALGDFRDAALAHRFDGHQVEFRGMSRLVFFFRFSAWPWNAGAAGKPGSRLHRWLWRLLPLGG